MHKSDAMKVKFFKSSADLRKWLEKNHDRVDELWIGFFNKGAEKKGVSYRAALDEALCFGWIDGVRKKVDDERYSNRFTPRKQGSRWSAVNIRRAHELAKAGRMAEPGLESFALRDEVRAEVERRERRSAGLGEELEAE